MHYSCIMPKTQYNRKPQYEDLDGAFLAAVNRLCKGSPDRETAEKTGLSRVYVQHIRMGDISLVTSRLDTILSLFPELKRVIINYLNCSMLYTNIEELTKETKIELIEKLVESLKD